MVRVAAILVPGSLLEETADPRIRAYKVGTVGRAAAVFGVPEILVYDLGEASEGRWIQRMLEYQACAPYLRKRLFPLAPDLSHVGVLPPLNLPTHVVGSDPFEGEVRMGLPDGRDVDIGAGAPAKARSALGPPTKAVPVEVVRVARGGHVEVVPYTGDQYTGSTVRRTTSLQAALAEFRHVVGTSRTGVPAREAKLPDGVALAFGSPTTGLRDVLGSQAGRLDYVNAVPAQATRTVRTEEAVWSTLAALANL